MRALGVALAAALLGAPAAAWGQPRPATLAAVDSLIVEGRTEDARVALTGWWDASAARAGRADAQRALWLRALLTVDPDQAGVDYQRLVVEYPGGAYSDRALLRLAQLAEAKGDPVRAREHLRTLVRDYPSSPYRLDAGRLLTAVEGPAEAAAAVSPPPVSDTAAPRPEPAPSAREPEALPPAIAPTLPDREPAAAGRWTVQLGAFASPGRARALQEALTRDGFDARLARVPGSPLIRVRSGRLVSEAEARELRDALVGRGHEATVADDALREETVP